MKISDEKKKKIFWITKAIVFVLIVSCAVKYLASCGNFSENGNNIVNTISFSGHGEINAVPDIANINFTISKDAGTVKDAQNQVAQVEKNSLDFLKTNGIANADIKTTDASFYPKYQYKYTAVPQIACISLNCPPPVGNNVIVGYTASENISVKIRNTDSAGKIIQGLGSLGVSNLNGPDFTVDNPNGLKVSARKLAIDEAKNKAGVLAKDLGIRLGKITSFSEDGVNSMPLYNAKAMSTDSVAVSAPAVLPTGVNLITSDVTITYEIK